MPSLLPIKLIHGSPTQILDENTQLNTVTASYTVPTGKRVIIKHIRITNLANAAGNAINIKTGSTTLNAANFVLRNVEVQPYDVLLFDMNEVLDAGEKIFMWQSALSDFVVQISGIEVTL